MLSVIAVVLVLGVLIFFHELGHFLVARLLGIGVRTFSLGFGPKLASFRPGVTEYRLSAIPLGGYVQLAGEQPGEETPAGFTDRQHFSLRPSWQKMCVVAAGPVFNLLLAWLIYWGLFWGHGLTELAPIIGKVEDGSPAMATGIRPGDRVLAINGKEIHYWTDLAETIRESAGALTVDLVRGPEQIQLQVTPRLSVRKNIFGEDIETPLIGVAASDATIRVELGGLAAAREGLIQTWTVTRLTVEGILKLIERIIPVETVGGPIMIAQMVSEQARAGLSHVLALTAVISINLGLINLLPIPVLDGGHILFFTLETILRRPLNQRVQEITTRMGLAVLILLMALALYNDITRLIHSAPL